MQGTETWSKLFFEAYAQGKTRYIERSDGLHPTPTSEKYDKDISKAGYEFLLRTRYGKQTPVPTIIIKKQIGACLAWDSVLRASRR